MKKLSIFVIISLFSLSILNYSSYSNGNIPTLKKHGRTIQDFIPNGWKLIKQTSGDLNSDGLADIAGVLEFKKTYNPANENAPERILFIALKNRNGTYTLSAQSHKAILKADEGGIWGDPFDSINVKKGVLLIDFYGGSNHRWGFSYSFKFRNNNWYLVEAEKINLFTGTGEGTKVNYNLVTGIMTVSKIKLDKVLKSEKKFKGKKLVTLNNFNATPDGTVF